MTIIANIKWYINDEEWGMYEPAPTLMSVSELLNDVWWWANSLYNRNTLNWWFPINYNDVLTELNSNPVLYYSKFLEENLIWNRDIDMTTSAPAIFWWDDYTNYYYASIYYDTDNDVWGYAERWD